MVSEWFLTEWYSEWSNGILNGTDKKLFSFFVNDILNGIPFTFFLIFVHFGQLCPTRPR